MITVNEGDIVDFSLMTDTVLGGKRTGVTVVAPPMSYSAAVKLDPNLNSKHKNMFTYFRDKVDNVDDPAKYKYFAVENANGTMEVIGVPWVMDSTYSPVTTREVTYVIHNFKEEWRSVIENTYRNLGAKFTSLDNTDVK